MGVNYYDEVAYAEISNLIDNDERFSMYSKEDKDYFKNKATDVMLSEYDFSDLSRVAKKYIDTVLKEDGLE